MALTMASLTPDHAAGFWPDFDWDNRLLWSLDLPSSSMEVDELSWLLDLPVWSSRPPAPLFDLVPRTVIESPGVHVGHARRVLHADLSYPLLVHHHRGRWVVLDGLHRLAKLVCRGATLATVCRVLPQHLAPAPAAR